MSVPKRLAVAAVTVAAATGLASSIWPPVRQHDPQAAYNDAAAQAAEAQNQQDQNRKATRSVGDAADRNEAAMAGERDAPEAADDVLRSLLRP